MEGDKDNRSRKVRKHKKKHGQQKHQDPTDTQQRPQTSHEKQKKSHDESTSEPVPGGSGVKPKRPQSQPGPQSGAHGGAWGQRGPQSQPGPQPGEPGTSWGQRGSQPQPGSQPWAQGGAWGQRGPQSQPGPQPWAQGGAWGQRGSQSHPGPQSGAQGGAWGQRGSQSQPGPQPGAHGGAWGQRGPQSQPGPQPGEPGTSWGQRGPQSQPGPQPGEPGTSRGQRGPQSQPVSCPLQPQDRKQRGPPKARPSSKPAAVGETSKALSKLGEPSSEVLPSHMTFAPRICSKNKSGRPITVAANFYRLRIDNFNFVIYDYDVKIDPDKPKFLFRQVWKKFVAEHFPGRLTAFTGTANAYSKGPLMEDHTLTAPVTVFNAESNREKTFNVTITEARRVSFQCLENYREKMLRDPAMKVLPEAETNLLDTILKSWATDNFVRGGRSFFAPLSKNPLTVDLSNKLMMRKGYYQSTFMGDHIYLNFDLSHKAFYRPMPMVKLADTFKWNNVINIQEMNSFIRGVKILYELPRDPSSRRIFGVNNLVESARNQFFEAEGGKKKSVAEYFEKEKSLKLRYPELPLLWVGPRQKTIYLPMEFCTVVPDQVFKGVMDQRETREMVAKATSNARTRKAELSSIFKEVNINQQPMSKEFGITVSTEMEKVEGRVLDPPTLRTTSHVKVDEGKWRIREFLVARELKHWCFLKADRRLPMQSIMDFQTLLKDRGRNFSMKVNNPSRNVIEVDPSPGDLERVFRELHNMDLVIVIIPDVKGVYSRVKTLCETRGQVLTQCVKSKTVMQEPRKIVTTVDNILLKVNAKLGGINHTLDEKSIPNCMKGKVMIVGADVTHPSPGMKIPSVAAVAVSCDEAAFKYSSTTRVQPRGEIILDLQEIMKKHIQEFYKLRKCYPEKIIFFRDGVSEGEMEKVFKSELLAVRQACASFCNPKITFLVVQKRHHTRFYPTSQRDECGSNFNVPPGTCVDSGIVHPRDLDFYLVSHASILGTARPTRYRLLYDDSKFTDEELEKVSYYLCHLFSRCNRTVSYPAPTYNAHLAAFRVRAYLEQYRGVEDLEVIQKAVEENISEKSPMFFV